MEDLPDDPYAASPSAPSILSGMPALPLAASTPFPPLTSPPHPLHLPTYNLLSATLTHLSRATSSAASAATSPAVSAIASQRVFRVLRQFVADWRYSERKLGLKEEVSGEQLDEAGDEEVVGMGDWLADAADGEEEDEGEVESMSMADFLGGPEDEAVQEAQEEDDDDDNVDLNNRRNEHRIDVGRVVAERKDSRPAVVKVREAKQLDEAYGEEEAEDELDEVRLDDLDLGDEETDESNELDLHLSPSQATTKAKGLK